MDEPVSYDGVEHDPVPEKPTREQALSSLSRLATQNLRPDAAQRHLVTVQRYLEPKEAKELFTDGATLRRDLVERVAKRMKLVKLRNQQRMYGEDVMDDVAIALNAVATYEEKQAAGVWVDAVMEEWLKLAKGES